MTQKFPIKVAAARSGLSTHLIRIWERRYSAVNPNRTPSNRRLYSDDDIRRLILLRQATSAGMSIGQIANLDNEELRGIIDSNRGVLVSAPGNGNRSTPRVGAASAESHLAACLEAVMSLETSALESALLSASMDLGQMALFEDVITPMFERIGDMWRDGGMKVSHEHMASAVVRTFLGTMLSSARVADSAPVVVVTTPSRHAHEAGALMAAITAVSQGWRSIYLGPDTPTEDVAGAATQSRAKAIAMSIVYPPDDPHMDQDLLRLRAMVGRETAIIIGGRSHPAYRETLDKIGAITLESLRDLGDHLERIRSTAASTADRK